MRFRLSPVVGALTLAAGILAATNVAAVRFQPLENSDVLVTPAKMPLGINTAQTTVVVQLAADPVAVAQANAGRKLSKQEKEQIKAQLKGTQNGLRGSIESLGGNVLGMYQSAYNGMKVRIARDKAGKLAELPGVVAVRSLQLMKPDNVHGVPMIGAPGVWQSLGLHGEGIRIAVIDTGIDYTHANFAGPGTVAAYEAAHANETSAADPALFGPAAPRVKGGIDLVGDDYDADPQSDTYQPVPHPDPNPLDCNGHGSHVAGTAAGSGVTDDGATFAGPYNASTVASHSWNVGPGVAPKAELYAVRVFGCNGSTDVTVDAIEWAVDNDMDVINMSLGSSFGSKDDPSAVATTNAARAGVIVVTSAGNSGPNQYITGSPGTAVGAIATAAIDPTPDFPGATIALADGTTMTAINANGHDFAGPLTGLTVKVLTDNPATPEDESLGCSVAAYGSLPPNTLAVANRGVCARVAKAIFGQQAGAAVVVMVNNANSLPPFEGKITSNPDDGTPFEVTIPFLGVRGGAPIPPASDGGKLRARDGMGASVTPVNIPNPNFAGFGDFSSGGPRTGDSALKPDIAAPGVSIVSTLSGGGNAGTTISGTSMASPHVAGVAALTRQAHPSWSVEDIKAAIVNTGSPASIVGYRTSRAGTGLVQPAGSTASQVVALASDEKFTASLNFGFAELTKDYTQTKTIKLRNNGSTPATFNVAAVLPSGSPHSTSINKSSVTVGPGANATVSVSLSVPAATAGTANGSGLSFQEVAGIVQFTPASASDNGGVALRVPYYFVPRPRSDVSTSIGRLEGTDPETVATVTNKHGIIDGDADFYAWGISSKKATGDLANDVRAVGVQSFPLTATEQLVVFAVNTYSRWSNASTNEFDIYVDVDGDGKDDYIVVGVDQGAIQMGVFNGRLATFVFSTRSGGASASPFGTGAPTDSSTALLPIRTGQLCRAGEPCLNAANPRMTYRIVSFDLISETGKDVEGVAKFNAWSSSISTGGFATVSPGGSDASNAIAVDSAEWALTPALGLMVVTLDNANGDSQAQLIPVKLKN
jgi:subtilisin family serine protease